MVEGRFSRHLGKGIEWKVEDEVFYLKPLGTESIPDFLTTMKKFGVLGKTATTKDFVLALDEEASIIVKKLIEDTLKISFPEEWAIPKEQEALKQLGFKNVMTLFPLIINGNSDKTKKIDEGKASKIAERLENDRNTKTTLQE